MKKICWYCSKERESEFPVSDETGDEYCPDCNQSQPAEEFAPLIDVEPKNVGEI